MSKLQIIRTNNMGTFLGTIEGNVITGVSRDASRGYMVMDCLGDYITDKAKGKLTTVTIGDMGSISVQDLTEEQVIEFERLKSLFKVAKKQAKVQVQCDIFNKLVGK